MTAIPDDPIITAIQRTGYPPFYDPDYDIPDDDREDEDGEEETALIEVRQLPIIAERLWQVKEQVELAVREAASMVCTEETVQTVKTKRAELRKQFDELEEQRKAVKTAVMGPYNEFERVYKDCISGPFKTADATMKATIDGYEQGLKDRCREALQDYFDELCAVHSIDFLPLDRALALGRVQITLADAKAELADDAATNANTKAALANTKAQLAAEKAQLAQEAADLATQKAQLAVEAADLATRKAQLAADAAAAAGSAADAASAAADNANTKAGLANTKAGYAQEQGDYAKNQGDYAKNQIDGAKGSYESIDERLTHNERLSMYLEETTDPINQHYRDEYLRVLAVLYQAIEDAKAAITAANDATFNATSAAGAATSATMQALQSSGHAEEAADLATAAAASAIAAMNAAKGNYGSLNERLAAIEAGKQDIIEDLAAIRSGATAGSTAYQKPADGIPGSDLDETARGSLAKAESALQPADVKPVATSGSYNDLDDKPGNLSDFSNNVAVTFEERDDPLSIYR